MDVAMHVLGKTRWRLIELDPMLINEVVVRRIGAGESNHPPRHHAAVSAVDRIAEETFDSALPKRRKENIGWHATEILAAGFQAVEIGVLLCCGHFGERRLGFEVRIDRTKRGPVEFGGRERQLISLARRASLPGAA